MSYSTWDLGPHFLSNGLPNRMRPRRCWDCERQNVARMAPYFTICEDCDAKIRRGYLLNRILPAAMDVGLLLSQFLAEKALFRRSQQAFFLKVVLLSHGSRFRQLRYDGEFRHNAEVLVGVDTDIFTLILKFACKSYRYWPHSARRRGNTSPRGILTMIHF